MITGEGERVRTPLKLITVREERDQIRGGGGVDQNIILDHRGEGEGGSAPPSKLIMRFMNGPLSLPSISLSS